MMNNTQKEGTDQASWENIDSLIKGTEKIIIDDEDNSMWNQFANTSLNNAFSNNYFGGNALNSYFNHNSNQSRSPLRANRPAPLAPTKSTSDYVTFNTNSPSYHPSSDQQMPIYYSPTLPSNQRKFGNPVLKLDIVSKTQYNLDKNDIFNVFSHYGQVVDVVVHVSGSAFITMSDAMSALAAQKALNEHYIKGSDVKLLVSWCNSLENEFARDINVSPIERNYISSRKFEEHSYASSPTLSSPTMSPTHPLKFTCKYEIQIENDKDFQVARKIIGSKGYNMKKIIDVCQKKMNNSFAAGQNDFLKLRLRGKGSGFKEGPEKKESDEPLHLCISSKHQEVYRLACDYVQDLLNTIYHDYRVYCQRTGRRCPENLKIKYAESVPNKENTFSPGLPRGTGLNERSSKLINLQYAGNDDQSDTNSTSGTTGSDYTKQLNNASVGQASQLRNTDNYFLDEREFENGSWNYSKY